MGVYKVYFLLVCNSIRLFSSKLTKGTIIKKCEKYNTVLICPNSMKGDSTCFSPICIKIKKFATNAKKANLEKNTKIAQNQGRYLHWLIDSQ